MALRSVGTWECENGNRCHLLSNRDHQTVPDRSLEGRSGRGEERYAFQRSPVWRAAKQRLGSWPRLGPIHRRNSSRTPPSLRRGTGGQVADNTRTSPRRGPPHRASRSSRKLFGSLGQGNFGGARRNECKCCDAGRVRQVDPAADGPRRPRTLE